jgi:hypothetical protein
MNRGLRIVDNKTWKLIIRRSRYIDHACKSKNSKGIAVLEAILIYVRFGI